jgi:predicted kinase
MRLFGKTSQRTSIEELARKAGIPLTGIWLDATADLVHRQADTSVRTMNWFKIDADQPIDALVAQLQVFLYVK